jgi:hypothetical protein
MQDKPVMMGTLSILTIAVLVAVLIAALVFAWQHDVRTERFRANLEPGQRVVYVLGKEPANGIVEKVGTGIVTLMDSRTLIRLKVEKHNIFEP